MEMPDTLLIEEEAKEAAWSAEGSESSYMALARTQDAKTKREIVEWIDKEMSVANRGYRLARFEECMQALRKWALGEE